MSSGLPGMTVVQLLVSLPGILIPRWTIINPIHQLRRQLDCQKVLLTFASEKARQFPKQSRNSPVCSDMIIAKVGYDKYVKFVWPLMLGLLVVAATILAVAARA